MNTKFAIPKSSPGPNPNRNPNPSPNPSPHPSPHPSPRPNPNPNPNPNPLPNLNHAHLLIWEGTFGTYGYVPDVELRKLSD